MPNYVSEPEFETLAPGIYNAKNIDVVNLGRVKSTWEGEERSPNKHRLIFEVEEQDSSGRPFIVRRDYTSQLSPNANLTKALESWRGRPFTPEEKKKFDLDVLVGKPCQLVIINAVSKANGKLYANIDNIMPFPKGMKPPISDPNYIRIQNRAGYKPPPPDPKTPAQIAREAAEEARRKADFLSEADMPKSNPTPTATDAPVADVAAAGEYEGTDDDVPF